MCDVCKKPIRVPIYTISIFSGERLTLCLRCADNHAEPLGSIIHGINNGALDNLPRDVKEGVTFYRRGRYMPLFAIKYLAALPPPPPKPDPETAAEDDALVRLMQKAAGLPKSTGRKPDEPSLARKLLVWGRQILFWRSEEPFPA